MFFVKKISKKLHQIDFFSSFVKVNVFVSQ